MKHLLVVSVLTVIVALVLNPNDVAGSCVTDEGGAISDEVSPDVCLAAGHHKYYVQWSAPGNSCPSPPVGTWDTFTITLVDENDGCSELMQVAVVYDTDSWTGCLDLDSLCSDSNLDVRVQVFFEDDESAHDCTALEKFTSICDLY